VIVHIAAAIAGTWLLGTILLLRFWASRHLAKDGSGRSVRQRVRRLVYPSLLWPLWFLWIAIKYVARLLLLACVGKAGREALRRNGK
jgi:hypothetical protein